MSNLVAFVGHSFSDGDEKLVGTFLEFLTTVSGVVPNFSWDHAEEAEPKILSEKVRAKMEGKNLFIAICTAKESTIHLEKLSQVPFVKSHRYGSALDFHNKTSDWVTQEIAYALGRDMDLIVLLEDGVRVPGGIQGDLEYIPFNRASPADSFKKILQMLKALTPKAIVSNTGMPSAAPADETPKTPNNDVEYKEPEATWKREDYDDAMAKAVWSENKEHQARIIEVFSKSPIATEDTVAAEFEAYSIYLNALFGKEVNLSRLRELVQLFPSDPRLHGYLAFALNRFSQFADAASEYIQASSVEADDMGRADRVADAAIAKHRSGDANAEKWLRTQFESMSRDDVRLQNIYLWALRQIAELQEAVDLWLCYTEVRLQPSPENHELRSDLAYKYFEQKKFPLALLHYLRIPNGERTANDWNNIGASYFHMTIPGRSIAAYRKSEALGGTTAVSNLASILIDSGFFEDAEGLCRKVVAHPDCDKRVAAALSTLDSKIEMETDNVNKVLEEADIQHRFFVDLGFACAATASSMPTGEWRTPECIVKIGVFEGHAFAAKGSFVRDETVGLRGILNSGINDSETGKRTAVSVRYVGTVVGRACFFTRTTTTNRDNLSIFGSASVKGYLIFSEDASGIREFRQPDTGVAFSCSWTKIQ